jgi:4-hydroxy-4-methyl-2-oxoglutarate aldolase
MATPSRMYGAVPAERIRIGSSIQFSDSLRKRFLALPDMACAVSDALDNLGLGGVVPARVVGPLASGARVCGPAATLRAVPYGGDPAAHRARNAPALLGDRDLYGLARPGDVAVLAAGGDLRAAVVGELSAAWARIGGIAALMVDGLIRDVEALRRQSIPVWSRGAGASSARYRLETVELNGPVSFAGLTIRPGDLIAADSNGIAVIPANAVDAVLAECDRAAAAEAPMADALATAGSLEELIARVGPVKENR